MARLQTLQATAFDVQQASSSVGPYNDVECAPSDDVSACSASSLSYVVAKRYATHLGLFVHRPELLYFVDLLAVRLFLLKISPQFSLSR